MTHSRQYGEGFSGRRPPHEAFGLPLEGIGILIALDLVPDMLLPAPNVTADTAVAALVAAGSNGPAMTLPPANGTDRGRARPARYTPSSRRACR